MPEGRRRLPPLAANLLLSAATMAVFLGGAEGLCRWLEPRSAAPRVAPYITDWAQWEGDFYTVKATAVGWPPFEDYNQDGLRDREHELAKPTGVRRLIVLGDSTTVGYRIRPEEAYPQVLQDRLDARGERVEVFNVALGGWSTRQELIAYRRIARRYGPDQVLVGVCLNDIPELGNNLSRPPGWLTALSRRSALVRAVVAAPQREIRSVEELFGEDSPKVKQAYDRLFADLRALRDDVKRDGADFGILVFPFRLQVEAGAPPPRPQAKIQEFCAAEGVPCLDLLPALSRVGEAAFVDYDHFTPLGSELVADEILLSGLLAGGPGRGTGSGGSAAGDVSARAETVRELGRRGVEAAGGETAVLAALHDDSLEVRRAAAWALGRFPARPAHLAALEAALRDPDALVRAGAAFSLGQLGPAARAKSAALLACLADPEGDVRRRVVRALEAIKPEAATSLGVLEAAVAEEGNLGRAEAAHLLGLLGPQAEPAAPALVRALRTGPLEVRQEALGALAAIGPRAAPLAVPALLEAFADPNLRWRVPDALGALGPAAAAAVPDLTQALRDPLATIRWRSAIALGRIGLPAAASAAELGRLVGDSQANVRVGAVAALSRVCSEAGACAEVLARALRDPEGQVRTKAAEGLGRLGPGARESIPALIAALGDESGWVRAAVVRALGVVGPGSPAVRAALDGVGADEEEMVRVAVDEARARLRATP